MREIIQLQVGQAGNQAGSKLWETFLHEHSLDSTGAFTPDASDLARRGVDVYFNEADPGKFVPRSVLVDLEPGVIGSIRAGPLGRLFRPANLIARGGGAGNNFAKGHFSEGPEVVASVMEAVRKEAEACESLQGFQLFHSLGGGTGSGLGTLLLSTLREEFPDKILSTYSIFPSPKSDTMVEPYNSILTVAQLLEHADATVILDNEALYNITYKSLKLSSPSFDDLNALIASAVAGLSSSFRFPGQINSSLRQLAVNLVPFPRLHFLLLSHAPLVSKDNRAFVSSSAPELISQMLDEKCMLAAVNPLRGKYLAAAASFRGAVSAPEIEQQMLALQTKHADLFVPFVPNCIKTSVGDAPGGERTATLLANHTGIASVFQRMSKQFQTMFRRKAFLHWYTAEGMEEAEFTAAHANVADVMQEYQQYERASA